MVTGNPAQEMTHHSPAELQERIVGVEHDIDSGSYRAGPWERLMREVRGLRIGQREALAEDISRVSRKLHQRNSPRTASVTAGLVIEGVAAIIGLVLLIAGEKNRSNVLIMVAALVWAMAFQPLIKVGVGRLLGIQYDYAYLYGAEPRFKMRFGTYIAAPRWKRVLLHLSGTVGSPLGLLIPAVAVNPALWVAVDICWAAFWIVVAINVIPLIAGLAGVKRIGPMKLTEGSSGAVALELREALEI